MKGVLIAADPATTMLATLALRLRWPDVEPVVASTATECIAKNNQQCIDLIMLQPESQKMALTRAIEEVRWSTSAPLMVLGRPDDLMEVVTALCSGADDYVKLPCSLTELAVRIWAVARRGGMTINNQNEAPLRSGHLLLNLATHEAFLGTQPVHLTSTEFRLLYMLIRNSGSVVTHSNLESTLREDDTDGHGLVKKYIQRLRRKLGDDAKAPHWIACIHGVGYRYVGPPPTDRNTSVSFSNGATPKPLAGVTA